jgi:hypothetical protein
MDPSENTVADGNVQLNIGQKEMGILAIPISTVNSCHLAAKIDAFAKLIGWLSKNFVLQGLVVFQGRRHTSSMSRS